MEGGFVTVETVDEIAVLRAQVEHLQAALREALDWATRFDGRHEGGYTSELLPMYTRIGDRQRAERLAVLAKLVGDP